ncbi:hypothetical protein [Streptomyces hoynatensis]|uniref:hypothetical protein n=1 Tax=Streptomyces hoynatensis TaxID=1141874 RepID=UPI001319ECC5|nr:hypothetical protein [Streptomyces hoynatensis]
MLPRTDINRKHYTLFVELTRRGAWIVHDGHGGYDSDGDWVPGLAVAHEFTDYEDALTLAKQLAPRIVNLHHNHSGPHATGHQEWTR